MVTGEAHQLREHLQRGDTLREEGKLREAEAEYRAVLEHAPTYADAHYKLASLYLEMGRTEEAMRALDRLLPVEELDLGLKELALPGEAAFVAPSEERQAPSIVAPLPVGAFPHAQAEDRPREAAGVHVPPSPALDLVEEPWPAHDPTPRAARTVEPPEPQEAHLARPRGEGIRILPPETMPNLGGLPPPMGKRGKPWRRGAFVGLCCGALLGFGLGLLVDPYRAEWEAALSQAVLEKATTAAEARRLVEQQQQLAAEKRRLAEQQQQLAEEQRQFEERQRRAAAQRQAEAAQQESAPGSAASTSQTLPLLLIKGEIVFVESMDLPNGLKMTVKDRYGFETPILLTGATKILRGKQALTVRALTPGTTVEVEYHFDVNTAKRHAVWVRVAAAEGQEELPKRATAQRQEPGGPVLAEFVARLAEGPYIVVVASYATEARARQDVETIRAKYPELRPAYRRTGTKAPAWAVTLGGTYALDAAQALKNKAAELGLSRTPSVQKGR